MYLLNICIAYTSSVFIFHFYDLRPVLTTYMSLSMYLYACVRVCVCSFFFFIFYENVCNTYLLDSFSQSLQSIVNETTTVRVQPTHVLIYLLFQEGPRTMVGIATFDATIHFYNLKRALQQVKMSSCFPKIENFISKVERHSCLCFSKYCVIHFL